eukprot:2262461-Rhodomonas_salina.2
MKYVEGGGVVRGVVVARSESSSRSVHRGEGTLRRLKLAAGQRSSTTAQISSLTIMTINNGMCDHGVCVCVWPVHGVPALHAYHVSHPSLGVETDTYHSNAVTETVPHRQHPRLLDFDWKQHNAEMRCAFVRPSQQEIQTEIRPLSATHRACLVFDLLRRTGLSSGLTSLTMLTRWRGLMLVSSGMTLNLAFRVRVLSQLRLR